MKTLQFPQWFVDHMLSDPLQMFISVLLIIILFKFSSLVICSMRYMWSSCFKWWFYLFKSILPRKISNLCSLVLQFLIKALVARAIEAGKVKDLRVLASVGSTWMRPCWGIFPEHLCIHFQTHDYCILKIEVQCLWSIYWWCSLLKRFWSKWPIAEIQSALPVNLVVWHL